MKKTLLTLSIAIISYSSYSQNTFPSSGNVGIGTTSPASKLEVAGVVAIGANAHNKGISFTGTLVEPTFGYYSAGINAVPTYGNGSSNMLDVIGIYTGTPTKGTSGTITNSYGLYVDNNSMVTTNSYGIYVLAPSGGTTKNIAAYFGGNVGIGTTSPAAPLHIGYDSGTTPGVLIGGGTSATNFIGFAANRAMVGYDATSNLALTAGSGKGIEFFVNGTNGTFPSGTEAMYVTNSGNVGIGTTSPGNTGNL